MKRYTFEEVSRLDDDLYQLALYAVTEGKIIIPKTTHEMLRLQEKIAEKFNYYKKIIHDGESTFDFIKHHVLSQYGPFKREEDEGNLDFNAITSYVREEDELQRAQDRLIKRTDDVLNALMDAFMRGAKRPSDTLTFPSFDEDVPPDFPEEARDEDLLDFDEE